MKTVGALVPALALSLALAAPAAAQVRQAAPAPTISKFESRRLPPEVIKQRIAEQLADLLVAPAERPAPGKPTRPLEDLGYATTPRATYVPGVCQSDTVIFRFRPVDEASRPGDAPTRLIGVEASTGYRLLRPAAEANAAFEKQQDDETDETNPLFYPDTAACGRMPTEDVTFAKADSPAAYLEAMAQLAAVQADVQAGKPLDMTCGDAPFMPTDACRAQIIEFDPTKVFAVTACPGAAALPNNQSCVRLDDWGSGLNIYQQWRAGRQELVRVHMPDPGIVIADMRRD